MKVLLINPPMQVDMEPLFPSFGMAYIAHEVKSHGHCVELLDIDANRCSKEEVARRIAAYGADVIGVGGLVTVYPYLHWLLPKIRQVNPRIEIVLGGPIASSLRERCFQRFPIDYEVIGEGETTIVELLREIGSERDFASIKGIGFRRNGMVVFTESRPLMPSLDGVPIFNDALFPMEKLLTNAKGSFQIHAQRGCPFSCTFCFNAFRVVSGHVRYRPVDHVVREIEFFRDKYKDAIKLFAISGECITMNRTWLIDFCRTMIDKKAGVKYRVTSRVDTIDEEKRDWLKKSGCVSISFGLESGSEKILKIMKKRTNAEAGKRAVRLARKYIGNIEASIMLGYIGEDRQTLADTFRFCKEIDVRPELFYATPFPGTELYAMAVERSMIRDEEEYMMGLDRKVIFDMSVNLTDMPEAEAKAVIKVFVRRIEKYYLFKKLLSMKFYFGLMERVKTYGLADTMVSACERLKRLFLS